MKNLVFITVLLLVCIKIAAQDQIFKRNGDIVNGKVMKISTTAIDYYLTGDETNLKQELKSDILKIIYSSGRVENYSSLDFPVIKGPDDWQIVEVTETRPNLAGLIEVKKIKASSMWGGTSGGAMGLANCIRDLKKKAAELGCPIVYMTDKKLSISTSVQGIAYKVNPGYKAANDPEASKNNNDQNKNKISNTGTNNSTSAKITADVDVNIPLTTKINGNYFAVIIGNENYSNEIKVPYAINDAKTFYEYTTKTMGIPSKQVHLLTDATYGQFLGEIEWLENILKVFKQDARIFIYYAGHGFPEESTKSSYILPVDGKSTTIASAIKLETLYAKLAAYASNNITFFLDACFSGASRDGMLTEGRGVKIKPKDDILNGKIVVFSATTGDETAHPIKEKQHGAFTYFLLKKMQETKGDATYSELYQYIKDNVSRTLVIENRSQNPVVNSSGQVKEIWKNWTLK